MKSAAVSIDLDEVHHYRRIHGLPASELAAHAAFDVGVVRALAFAERHRIPLTLFAVGEDLGREKNRVVLERATSMGHAVESHSQTHPYDLSRRSEPEIRREIELSLEAIEGATGRRPKGFRAPGYLVSEAMFDAIEASGLVYDSSLLPSPPYFAAKLLALGWLALRGKSSASIVGSSRMLTAPTVPYRPGKDWWKPGARSLIELPIQVTRVARAPVIGTALTLTGEWGARSLVRSAGEPELFNLELHAIDFLDHRDGLADLLPHQLDLRVPWEAKLKSLEACLRELRKHSYSFVRLDEAAAHFSATC